MKTFLFPAIVLVILFVFLFLLINRKTRMKTPISAKSSKKNPIIVIIIIFVVFSIVGIAISYFLIIQPVSKSVAAKKWDSVPCKIISSNLREHYNDDGKTYSVDIQYSYKYKNKEYTSSKYNFLGGSTSLYNTQIKILKKYPAGSENICYVNPDNPSEAVLNRGIPKMVYIGIGIIIFLIFILVLIFLSIKQTYKKNKVGVASSMWLPLYDISDAQIIKNSELSGLKYHLPDKTFIPIKSRIGSFFIIVLISIFWNAIVISILLSVINESRGSGFSLFTLLFLLPFVVVGIILIGAVFYFFLALFNPKIIIKITPGYVFVGERNYFEWDIVGNYYKLNSLSITLQGKEEVSYRRGTSTYTDHKIFFLQDILDVSSPNISRTGRGEFIIPENSIHSFETSNNKIIWELKIHGEISNYPDVNESYKICVVPKPIRTL